jgi:hypothetical protein
MVQDIDLYYDEIKDLYVIAKQSQAKVLEKLQADHGLTVK